MADRARHGTADSMKSNVQESGSRLDGLKWVIVVAITVGAAWGNVQYAAQPVLVRGAALLVVAVLACVIALQTTQGGAFLELARAARVEIRKVVWPTREEATQTTLVVVAVVLVMALLLWGLDTLLGWLASLLIG
jgi:preprotein translocase subunit SecE